MTSAAYIDLDELERAERWGPAREPEPDRPTIPLFWHGDAAGESVPRIVKGLLPSVGIALLAGQSGAGKTFLALDLAGSLSTGEPFFGRKIRSRGGTLFLAAEAVSTIPGRLEAMRSGRGFDAVDRLPIAWREVGHLSNPDVLQALLVDAKAVAAEMQARHQLPLALIVVDTLAAAFGFQDENAAAEATKSMQALQALSQATGALVIAIAHYGKSSETGVRGSSAFTASADTILAALVERDIAGKVTSRTLALTKSRDDETGWNCPFELAGVDLGTDDDGDPITSCFIDARTESAQANHVPRGKAGGMPKAVKAYRDALTTVVGNTGKQIRPFGSEGPQVWAVDREEVRAEFYSRWPADGDTEQKRADARRKQFNRGEQGAIAGNVVHIREIAGAQLVWALDHVKQEMAA